MVYTYRVIPINYELLQNGVLLEGAQSVQIAQARAPSSGKSIWDRIRGFFGSEGDGSTEASRFDVRE